MQGGASAGRAQHPGGLERDARSRTVTEERERHRQQRLQDRLQSDHQRAQIREWHLVHALAVARQLHGTEIDVGGRVLPQRHGEEGIASRMRKPEDAPSNRGVLAPVWNPFVEHDTVPDTAARTLISLVEVPRKLPRKASIRLSE